MILGIAALAAAATAAAGDDSASRQYATYTLIENRPGKLTAERFLFDYANPDDPEAKPPPVRRVVTKLPRGGRFDTSAPGLCKASDTELIAQGATACPAESAIGGGVVTVDTGLPGPGRIVDADVEFFNDEHSFIYLNTVRGTGARTVIRADVTRRKTITEVDELPGAPPDGGAIDTVDLTVAAVASERNGVMHNYITTPRRCPRDGTWTTRVKFFYGDGERQMAKTDTPCKGKRTRR